MSPYLPAGEPTTDPTTAAASYLQALAGLSDQRWITIRAENRDLWPFTERMTGGRVNAWLAAVILLQATVSAALVPTEVLASCWEPFAGVLEPLG